MTLRGWVLVGFAAIYGLGVTYRFALLPFFGNLAKREVAVSTQLVKREIGPGFSPTVRARDNVARSQFWITRTPEDVGFRMLLMVNLMRLKRYEDAERAAVEALRYDIRPEIYFNMGLSQLEQGRKRAAAESFGLAIRFDPLLQREVPSSVESSSFAYAASQQNFKWNYILNPSFHAASIQRHSGLPYGWGLRDISGGMNVGLQPSGRGRGRMLEVRTSVSGEGVVQVWRQLGVPPAEVTTEAWIFIESGSIGVYSGRLEVPDAALEERGKWVLVSGSSSSCRVDRTYILSLDGPAHFFIDHVDVRATSATDCSSR
jgi:tetratricopeptide (TPR) repeat protein